MSDKPSGEPPRDRLDDLKPKPKRHWLVWLIEFFLHYIPCVRPGGGGGPRLWWTLLVIMVLVVVVGAILAVAVSGSRTPG